MNALLALTIEIPDWLFDGRFWGGFFTAFFIMLGLIGWGLKIIYYGWKPPFW